MPELSIKAADRPYEPPHVWAKPVEGELWRVLDAIDKARLGVAGLLREDPESHEQKRFSVAFDHARAQLEKLLLDVLCPEIADKD